MGENGSPFKALPKEVADTLALYLRGLSPSEIAAELGVSYKCIWERLRRPDLQAKLMEIQDEQLRDAAGTLKRLSGEAVQAAAAVMRDSDAADSDTLRAAFGILDRAGLGPTQKHEVEHETTMELVVNGDNLKMPEGVPPPPQLPEPADD